MDSKSKKVAPEKKGMINRQLPVDTQRNKPLTVVIKYMFLLMLINQDDFEIHTRHFQIL